jgi:transcriptional regulator with XRE-family HTH domain
MRQILVDARKAAGLRQEDVAERLGKTQAYVSKYEQGERRLDVEEMIEVCEALGLNPEQVVRQIVAVRR